MFMHIRSIEHFSDYVSFNGNVLNGVSFLDSDQVALIYNVCNGSALELNIMFNQIGVKFDDISIMREDYIAYSVNDKVLSLSKLSSGERFILFLMACKKMNSPVLAIGLFERLSKRLTDVVYNNFKDYDNLIILLSNVYLSKKFFQWMEG